MEYFSAIKNYILPFAVTWMDLERIMGFPCGSAVNNSPAMWETWVRSLGCEDPLEKGKTIHSNILAWRIPRTVESMRSQRVGHN